jgi:WD40 repeat protein
MVGTKLLDAATGQEGSNVNGLAYSTGPMFSPDGRRLANFRSSISTAVSARGARIEIWDAQSGKKLLAFGGMGSIADITYSPDGRRLAATGLNSSGPGLVKVWDSETGLELLTVSTRLKSTNSIAFRPDGHKLIVAGSLDDGRPAVEVLDGSPLPPAPAPGGALPP